MLPFDGSLACLSAPNAYTEYEVKKILTAAEGLEVIPLVQTIGHCENLLQHECFAMLREDPDDYGTLCPFHPDTPPILDELLSQIRDFHPKATKIHIGCDEPTLGEHRLSRAAHDADSDGFDGLLVQHVSRTAAAVRSLGFRDVLMWHDAASRMSVECLEKRLLPCGVTLVVWDYAPKLTQDVFASRLSFMGASPYVASAWKGADGAEAVLPSAEAREANQRAWISWAIGADQKQASAGNSEGSGAAPGGSGGGSGGESGDGASDLSGGSGDLAGLDLSGPSVPAVPQSPLAAVRPASAPFKGVVLTGWSRYGYMMPLTESLIAGMPSLLSALSLWGGVARGDATPRRLLLSRTAADTPSVATEVTRQLADLFAWEEKWREIPMCAAELHSLFLEVEEARQALSNLEERRRQGQPPAIARRCSPKQERDVRDGALEVLNKLRAIGERARSSAKGYTMTTLLKLAFTGDSVDEWLGARVDEAISRALTLTGTR